MAAIETISEMIKKINGNNLAIKKIKNHIVYVFTAACGRALSYPCSVGMKWSIAPSKNFLM